MKHLESVLSVPSSVFPSKIFCAIYLVKISNKDKCISCFIWRWHTGLIAHLKCIYRSNPKDNMLLWLFLLYSKLLWYFSVVFGFSHFSGETICFVFQIYYFDLNRLCVFSINQVTFALFTILKVLGNCSFIFQLVKIFLQEGFISLFWSNMLYCFCPFLLYFCHLVLMLAGFAAIKMS